ncbi:DUF300-domain-containing protein [Pseudovirgaria hyperparasitica]|uniref:DUF300-domain-containing protein n=1 Tax=Pseudovirgaria hyperparasitica TaxID=470096 RepID=A0A6A6WF31_9PEZI|nr:DUF300-domain-containing protein [Pseudovirgaria hyperparasitica]KAF2760496.1 DUF300-domain-containing protein [Pseudovirgaria hyperparasitica]
MAGNGTGSRFNRAVIIVAGVAALVATALTCVKNYRKPLLQRYVVRILVMVPIFSAASWASLTSLSVAFWVRPVQDVYEAFTIYTFFQLLINFLGGERALIVMMHGRRPVSHLWPLNHCLPKVDISDPHTFLAIKRGILQYTWVKPVLAVAAIILKATGTYKEGYLGVTSGYFWSGLIYNVSITVCLYALALFWVCMSADLQPFRPMPKFLCVKGIIFASYWQGFFLSILVWLNALPNDVQGYTPDNLAASIQDALISFEMPLFAILHWYAFSWHDYADVTISSARMPIKYALRDAFGPRDLIEDTKGTFSGKNYEYRYFDARDNVLGHEQSASRTARMMEGMRYERGGKGKYWIPKPGEHADDSRTPLLKKAAESRARTMSPGAHRALETNTYGVAEEDNMEESLDPEEEQLYTNARALEFGDCNYPVITAHTASREQRLYGSPTIVSASTNRHVLQPTRQNKQRRKSRIQHIQEEAEDRRNSESSSNSKSPSRLQAVGQMLKRNHSSSSGSGKSDRSQLVDLVVEDHEAEDIERVRARKEGGPGWNEAEPKHYVKTYPEEGEAEVVREGFEPDAPHTHTEDEHNLDRPFADGDNEEDVGGFSAHQSDEALRWQTRDHTDEPSHSSSHFGSFREERDVWGNAKEQDQD